MMVTVEPTADDERGVADHVDRDSRSMRRTAPGDHRATPPGAP